MNLSSRTKDLLLANNFKLIHEESVKSTMTSIKKFVSRKNICMLADEQTSGIGRRGNDWISPKGNIYASFLIKYDLSIENHFLFSAMVANSIIKFLNKYIHVNINIKWPNDIIINKKKIAGIMTEIFEHNNIQYIIIGVGINILTAPKIIDYKTSCLKDYMDSVNFENVLITFIESFFHEYEMITKKKYNQIFNSFKNQMSHIGSRINMLFPDGNVKEVLIKNLNYNGSLIIQEGDKEINVFSGRIINDFN